MISILFSGTVSSIQQVTIIWLFHAELLELFSAAAGTRFISANLLLARSKDVGFLGRIT